MALHLSQNLKQTQKLTTKQIQLFNILALPTIELEQYIANEMALNPALEFETDDVEPQEKIDNELDLTDSEFGEEEKVNEGVLGEDYDYSDYMDRDSLDDYKYEVNNSGSEETKRETIFLHSTNFTEQAIEQLNLLTVSLDKRQKELAVYLLESLDSDGYLRTSLSDLADEISFQRGIFVDEQELEGALKIIHTLEPFGIGARNLQECLLIQLNHIPLKTKDTYNAISILTNHFEDLTLKKNKQILVALKISKEELEDAMEELKTLNPKPANSSSETVNSNVAIIPDFTVSVDGDQVELFLNQAKQPALKISTEYIDILNDYSKSKDKEIKKASLFFKDKVESAKWFIEALQQRESMMVLTAKAIVNHQKKFFITGDKNDLEPMILKNIAEKIGSDVSTISRIANTKYITTPFGTLLIKDLFVQGIANDNGVMISTHEIKSEINKHICSEDKHNPMSDEQIVKLLAKRNYQVSRRTVAKYRDELNIPNKTLRKAA
jgi:RNA polymerase sigma-54 factor